MLGLPRPHELLLRWLPWLPFWRSKAVKKGGAAMTRRFGKLCRTP